MVIDLLTGIDPAASWILAIAILAVVSAVVWLLLHLIATTAAGIKAGAAQVWVGGQRVANNTIHIAKAHQIAGSVEAILMRAAAIAASSEAFRAHAQACSDCPECFLGKR